MSPGNPFKAPFKGGARKASPKRPQTPSARGSTVPKATSPIGNSGRAIRGSGVRAPRTRVTTKGRHSMPMPSVRQGTKLGTPGRHG